MDGGSKAGQSQPNRRACSHRFFFGRATNERPPIDRKGCNVMMKIRPLHDRVVVERLDEERKSAGGIVIPDNVAEKPDQGEVIAVGKGKILEDGKVRPLDVKVGDRILFGKFSGQAVKVEGTEYLVMREDDIMGVVAK